MSFYATISLTDNDAVWSLQTQRYATIKEIESDIAFFVRKRFLAIYIETALRLFRDTPLGTTSTAVLSGCTLTIGCFASNQAPSIRF